MARPSLWIGIDVGADEITICATDDSGHVLFEQSLIAKATAVHELLRARKRCIKLIGIESCSFSIALTRSLRKLGYPIVVFEARQASKFLAIRKNKTDKNDARGLAELTRLGRASVSEVKLKSPECQRLRSTLATRQKLVQLRTAMEGSLRSLLRLNGGKLKNCSSLATLRKNVKDEVTRLRKSEKIDLRAETEPLVTLAAATRAYVDALDARLRKQAEDHPICRRFLEIPGVGPITALSFFSSIDDPGRFRRNADVGAYLGLIPMVRESGQLKARRRISKSGDKMTRTYLATAAQHHIHFADSALSTWAKELSRRLGKRGVQTAVARKLAVIMLALWKGDEQYEPYPTKQTRDGTADPRLLLT